MEQGANLSDEQKLLLNGIVKEWKIDDHTGEEIIVEELKGSWDEGVTGYDTQFLGEDVMKSRIHSSNLKWKRILPC